MLYYFNFNVKKYIDIIIFIKNMLFFSAAILIKFLLIEKFLKLVYNVINFN